MGFWHFLFVRAALFYLVYAAFLGTLFYLFPGLAGPFRPSHVHAGLVGFFLQMVMGVAYWMMPRPGGSSRTAWRGSPSPFSTRAFSSGYPWSPFS